VLFARKTLFLCRGNDMAASQQAGGTIMVKTGYGQNIGFVIFSFH
jgi:hypothetical protein